MPSAKLLNRIDQGPTRADGPILVSLDQLLWPLSRSFWPRGVPSSPIPLTPSSLKIIESRHVRAFSWEAGAEWARYEDIEQRFRDRRVAAKDVGGGTNTSVLAPLLVESPIKLIIADNDAPIRSVVCWQRVYPKRAWVGVLRPNLPAEWLFLICGLLNSALGQALYRRARATGTGGGHDVRQNALKAINIPILAYDVQAFANAALLSYRLHCLHLASQEIDLPATVADVDIPNHRYRLLSELARLYGFDETESQSLIEEVLPGSLDDVPGYQGDLLYLPREPFAPIKLSEPGDSLERQKSLWRWEQRINAGIPTVLHPDPWPGISEDREASLKAHRHITERRGPRFGVADPRRVTARLWEVDVYYVPPRNLTPDKCINVPTEWSRPGRHSAGKLWVDGISGRVFEDRKDADAFAAGS